jgi:hypothetical protein
MANKKPAIALFVGCKGETSKPLQKDKKDISISSTDPRDIEFERLRREEHLIFVASIRRLIGFLRARDLIYAMPFFNSWCGSPQDEAKENLSVHVEAIHKALALLSEWSTKVSDIERPILEQLENHATALETKVVKATLEHEVAGAMHDAIEFVL